MNLDTAERRFKESLMIISNLNAHVIALQEISKRFLNMLEVHPLYKAYPYRIQASDCLILSCIKMESKKSIAYGHNAPSALFDVNGKKIAVINGHTTSLAKNHQRRKRQMQKLVEKASRHYMTADSIILVGDLNMHLPLEEKNIIDLHKYARAGGFESEECVDVWKELRGEKDGYTYDSWNNAFIRALRPMAENVELFANKPIPRSWGSWISESPVMSKLFPSDHFGILAQFKL
ncbi:hypothetical protein AAMO2058_001353700 [Amorphochlora amoebiformis]